MAASQLPGIGRKEDRTIARAITARAPTLVKDVQSLLPLSLSKHHRALVVSGDIVSSIHPEPMAFDLPQMLRDEGFAVTVYTPNQPINPQDFELMLYLLGEETPLTRGRIFLDWARLAGNFHAAMGRHWHDILTAMISFGYPCMLYGAPRMPCYINAYATMPTMQSAVVDCLGVRRGTPHPLSMPSAGWKMHGIDGFGFHKLIFDEFKI